MNQFEIFNNGIQSTLASKIFLFFDFGYFCFFYFHVDSPKWKSCSMKLIFHAQNHESINWFRKTKKISKINIFEVDFEKSTWIRLIKSIFCLEPTTEKMVKFRMEAITNEKVVTLRWVSLSDDVYSLRKICGQ